MHCGLKARFFNTILYKGRVVKTLPVFSGFTVTFVQFADVIPLLGTSGDPAKEKVVTNDSDFSTNSRESNKMGFF